jgi:hypothetical protein
MKRIGLVALALLAVVAIVQAEMDDKDYNFTLVSTAAYTNSYTLRGTVKAVEVDVAAGSTQTVAITSGKATLFSKSCTADARYDLLYPAYGYDATALTLVSGTNNVANVVYKETAVAGPVTVIATGATGATTNALKVTLIYDR